MSQKDAQSFLKRVEQDSALRQEVLKAAEARDVERLIAIGAQHNLRFTASELDEAANEQRFGAGTRELSDSQLEGVAGGWTGWVSRLRGDTATLPQGEKLDVQVKGESTDGRHTEHLH